MTDAASALLQSRAIAFADKIATLLERTLPTAPGMEVTQYGNRFRIQPAGGGSKGGRVPLLVQGEEVAWLQLNYLCRLDTTDRYLAVDSSSIWVIAKVDRTPIFRFEYLYKSDRVPHSHIHVHAQRGALSHLLSKAGHEKPHEMAALHLPTGGARFRPDLEDVIQFLVLDCGFDSVEGWLAAVKSARAEWRVIQTRAVTRAMAAVAAEELRSLGYAVSPPEAGEPEPGQRMQHAW